MDENKNIIFFDGECHLCNGFVDFLISKDKGRHFFYAPLQGTTAQKILSELSDSDTQTFHSTVKNLESIMLHFQGRIYTKSEAIFEIIKKLPTSYRLLLIFKIIPRFIRDKIYDLIARYRYHLFGKRNFCRRPTEQEKAYLLD